MTQHTDEDQHTDEELFAAACLALDTDPDTTKQSRVDRAKGVVIVILMSGRKRLVFINDLAPLLDDPPEGGAPPGPSPVHDGMTAHPLPLFSGLAQHLPAHIHALLQDNNLGTVAKLEAATDFEILALAGIGPHLLQRIRDIVAQEKII